MKNIIAESELIITSKGSIYHLDLLPEQLADTVITVGDPDRVAEVSKYFDRIEHKAKHREFITHTGFIGKKHLSVISTGIGPDNIDIVFNELDALANIDFKTRTIKEKKKSLNIIRLGTCGSLQEDVPVDHLIVSSHGIGLDNLLHYYSFENNEEEKKLLTDFEHQVLNGIKNIIPYATKGSEQLAAAFTQNFVHGITITCPGFYGPQGRVLRGPIAMPGLIDRLTGFHSGQNRIANFEMETSAMYGLGKIFGHQCLSISVAVANRISKTFSLDGGKAVDNMIRHCLSIIEKI